jgi:hypothetical protein
VHSFHYHLSSACNDAFCGINVKWWVGDSAAGSPFSNPPMKVAVAFPISFKFLREQTGLSTRISSGSCDKSCGSLLTKNDDSTALFGSYGPKLQQLQRLTPLKPQYGKPLQNIAGDTLEFSSVATQLVRQRCSSARRNCCYTAGQTLLDPVDGTWKRSKTKTSGVAKIGQMSSEFSSTL